MARIVRTQRQDFTALLLGAAAFWLSQAANAEQDERVTVLVANQGFDDAPYAHTVVVLPRDGSEEVGVIIDRPGPFLPQQLVALIRDEKSPGEGSMQLAHGLYLSIGAAVLERAVERSPGTARYYAGLVAWQPGELADELRRGLWLKLEVPLDMVFRRDATGLWDELLLAAQAVTA